MVRQLYFPFAAAAIGIHTLNRQFLAIGDKVADGARWSGLSTVHPTQARVMRPAATVLSPLFAAEPGDEFLDAFLDFDFRMIAEEAFGFGDVGVGERNVARLVGEAVDGGLFAEGFFDEFDQAGERDAFGFAKVEDFEAEFFAGGSDNAVDGVGDEGVVAGGGAIAEYGDWFTLLDELGEFVYSEVGPLARAVNGEEAEHDDVHAVDVVIDMAEGFAGEFAGGVGRDGMENRIGFGEGSFGINAVDGGGGGDGDFLDVAGAGGFEDVCSAGDIDFLVEGGFFKAGANAGARGKMNDLVEASRRKKVFDGGSVTEVAFDEVEFGEFGEFSEVSFLACGVVKIVQVVKGGDFVSFGEETFGKV